MLRAVIVSGAALVGLASSGCAQHPAAAAPRQPSQAGSELAAYVMDTNSPQAPSDRPVNCSKGKGAYDALVAIVSADTGMSVQRIVAELQAGSSLNDIAGSRQGEVKQQAMALVHAELQFAVANGILTQQQADGYAVVASRVVDALMAANVSSCIPAGSSGATQR